MAIHPNLPSSPAPQQQQQQQGSLTANQASEISSWTEQAAQSLRNLHISDASGQTDQTHTSVSPPAAGASSTLVIPLDGEDHRQERSSNPMKLRNVHLENNAEKQETPRVVYRRRESFRRDSLKRREALLKGKEGSRRRQRWENDRLLSNPWAQQPSSSDWQVQPTYPRHTTMPYYLAPLWDAHYAAKEEARVSRRKAHAHSHIRKGSGVDGHAGEYRGSDRVPKELRLRLKHARAAKGLLQDLEEDIRKFLHKWNEKQVTPASGSQRGSSSVAEAEKDDDKGDSDTDEEDEIVFAGRKHTAKLAENGQKPSPDNDHENDREKLVFESSADDQGAGFGRWLVHSLASYYGLRTWSVTVGNPPRREAYVGIDSGTQQGRQRSGCSLKMVTGRPAEARDILPRPLWASV